MGIGNYDLEISSPGADRPFFKLKQFEQFTGSKVVVNLFRTIDGRKKITGLIDKVEDSLITLLEDGKTFKVPFDVISKARLVPEYIFEKGEHNGK